MKIGLRTPSLKRSISARTKGQFTRAVKRALIPGYGKPGMGILHPKRALYNKVYRMTTFSIFDLAKGSRRTKRSKGYNGSYGANGVNDANIKPPGKGCLILLALLVAAMMVFFCIFL